ncbi:Xenobiotic-transporting_ATPase / Multidrug resistance-associated protein [Hexamita inflata]|uniref:Xenobiotic-transporting ATPase / Multidrug resistance-associated protein n=1 Tax=Hexamita inflata TaxID=28002 RepID=A0AA86QNU8_9EUKA|nr:Xenobiotic-transporting ATPase / Multidrug resistance-associated protein [Hexamita inflata]CAI9961965.1 Xenobiotic-transporting ATPase / Multidrug resistance-associated protein [Hexamita inflata]
MIDVTWSWLNPITNKAKKHQTISQSDIQKPQMNLNTKQLAKQYAEQYRQTPTQSILKNFLKVYKRNLLGVFIGIPLLTLSSALGPLCIRYFQTYLSPLNFFDCNYDNIGNSEVMQQKSVSNGMQWVFNKLYPFWIILGLGQILRSFADSICSVNCIQMGVKMTGALLDILFNKMLVLSETTKNINAQGSLANILFTDTMKIQYFMKQYYYLFTVQIDVIVATIYLGSYISPIALLGTGGLLIFVPMIIISGKIMSKSFKRLATLKDSRSQKIQEILNGIKVIKLFNLEQFQEKRIENARNEELKLVKTAGYALTGMLTSGFTSYNVMSLLAFGCLIAFDKLEIQKSFTMIYLFTFIQVSVGFLPGVLMALSDGLVSLQRINSFLKLSQLDQTLVQQCPEQQNAIEIQTPHNYQYGSELDYQVSPNLDSSYYYRIERIKEMKKQKQRIIKFFSKLSTNKSKLDENINEIFNLIAQQKYDLTNSICSKICFDYNLPAISYFMSPKNYSCLYFEQAKGDKYFDIIKKNYLHLCVIYYNIQQSSKTNTSDNSFTIKQLQLSVKQGELVGIKGSVGSGKSSLFSCILGEMKVQDFQYNDKNNSSIEYDYFDGIQESKEKEALIKIGGKIAFCPQNSPIFSASIRENICFYQPYDEQRYQHIVDICCLLPDFEIFNAGDLTEVGGRGVTLSGGQRARISLARAIYNNADIYLLDDPLSAVDAHVGKRIWNEVILNYLKAQGKTVLIASHQTQYILQYIYCIIYIIQYILFILQ